MPFAAVWHPAPSLMFLVFTNLFFCLPCLPGKVPKEGGMNFAFAAIEQLGIDYITKFLMNYESYQD